MRHLWFFAPLVLLACVGDSTILPDSGSPDATTDGGADVAAMDVVAPEAGVASFDVTTTATSVTEHQPFQVSVTAKRTDGSVMTEYAGSPKVSSTWGDARTNTATFTNGVALLTVSLNRETNGLNGPAEVRVADGGAVGASTPITVTLPPLTTGSSALLKGAGGSWDANVIWGSSAMARDNSGVYYLLYSANNGSGATLIGGASALNTTTDFTKYTNNPVFVAGTNAWESYDVNVADLQRDGSTFVLLYSGSNQSYSQSGYGFATSTDGKTFTRKNQITFSGSVSGCDSLSEAHFVVDAPNTYRMFYWGDTQANSFCTAVSSDGGVTWPAANRQPIMGLPNDGALSQVVKDGSVYKAYVDFIDNYYYTSGDGINWIESPQGKLSQPLPITLVMDPVALTIYGLTINNSEFYWVSRP